MKIPSRNSLLLTAVVLITALPLYFFPAGEGKNRFGGSDDQAQEQIRHLAPDYQPWFKPLLTPASPEIASLLFALQAALGAGVLGYWLGAAVTRQRLLAEFAAGSASEQAAPKGIAPKNAPGHPPAEIADAD